MNIEYLREFAELAKRLNVTEAAHMLNMQQPTLSKHIAFIEKKLGVTLFERSTRSLRLTSEGAALLPHAYKVIDEYGHLCDAAKDMKKSPPPRLRIHGLTDEAPSAEILGFVISALGDRYGVSAIEVSDRPSLSPAEILNDDIADIVAGSMIDSDWADGTGFKAVQVGEVPLVAISSLDNPIASASGLTIPDLRDSTIIRCEGLYISRSWYYFQNACEKNGFDPRTHTRYCSNTTELLALCADLGQSVLVIGKNFSERLPEYVRSLCSVIDIEDSDAVIPLHFLYSESNSNPMLRDLLKAFE